MVLIILVLQTSLTVLFLRYSRTKDNGQPFIPTTVVFMTECLKYLLCLLLLLATSNWSLLDSLVVFREEDQVAQVEDQVTPSWNFFASQFDCKPVQ